MLRAIAVALTLMLATASTFGQESDGEIGGRVRGAQAHALPGVRVIVSSGTDRREAITDKDGRFAIVGLRLAQYDVAAELAGFLRRSGTITLSALVRRAYVDWSLDLGCLREAQRVILDAREAAPLVETIAHVRVTAANGSTLFSTRPECPGTLRQSYTVEVLKTVLERSGPNDSGRAGQIFLSRHGDVLSPGQEYVAMLWPDRLAADGLVFPVVSDRISAPFGKPLSGMRLDEALQTLAAWARRARLN